MALDDRDYMRRSSTRPGDTGNPSAGHGKSLKKPLAIGALILSLLLIVAVAFLLLNGPGTSGSKPSPSSPPGREEPKPLPMAALDAEALAQAKTLLSEYCLEYKGDVFACRVYRETFGVVFAQKRHELGPLTCDRRPITEADRLNGLEWVGYISTQSSPYRFWYPDETVLYRKGWSDWGEGGSVLVGLHKVKGQWEVTWLNFTKLESEGLSFKSEAFRKPTTEEIERMLGDK